MRNPLCETHNTPMYADQGRRKSGRREDPAHAIVAQLVERLPSKQEILFASSSLVYRSGSYIDRCARQSGKTLGSSDRRIIWRVPIVGKAERLMNLG